MALPENKYKLRRFNVGMAAAHHIGTADARTQGLPHSIAEIRSIVLILPPGYDWKALPQDSVVVDVGGGIGSQSLILAQAFENLKFIVQDQEVVLKQATKARCSEWL